VTTKRLPWKYEGKKVVIKKSEWSTFVEDVERRLCSDLNKEIENTNRSLKQVLDERDKLALENRDLKATITEVRKCVRAESKPK
jgi:regulator of replication initiation timing